MKADMKRAAPLLFFALLAGCVSDMQRQWEGDVLKFVDMNQLSVNMKDADQMTAADIADYDRAMLRGDVALDQMRDAIGHRNWFRFVSHRTQFLRERAAMTKALTQGHYLRGR